jgi:hypothetical protein
VSSLYCAYTHYAATPETAEPEFFCRFGNLVDLVAWDPRTPLQWTLRVGVAAWLGCVPPQYLAPAPVHIRRSVLSWLRSGCTGLVPLSPDLGIIYSLLMTFGELRAEDPAHAAELRRIVARPWSSPRICAGEAFHAAR